MTEEGKTHKKQESKTTPEVRFGWLTSKLLSESLNPTKKLLQHLQGDKDDAKAVQAILGKGAVVNVKDASSMTPLLWAAKNKHVDSLKVLLNAKADWHIQYKGKDALALVIENGDEASFDLLSEKYNRPSPMHVLLAAKSDNEAIFLKVIAKLPVSIGSIKHNVYELENAIYHLVENNKLGRLQKLVDRIESLKDYPKSSPSPLRKAVENNNPDMVRYLRDKGYVRGMRDYWHSLLAVAARSGYSEVVAELLVNNAFKENDYSGGHIRALWESSAKGHESIAKKLLEASGSKTVNYSRYVENNNTALSFAAMNGKISVVRVLLAVPSIKIDHRNSNNMTPLMLAAKYGHVDVVKVLLETKKVDVNVKNKKGKTAFELAKNGEIAELLFQAQALDINGQDKAGNTKLHDTYRNGSFQALQLFIAKGADQKIENKKGLKFYQSKPKENVKKTEESLKLMQAMIKREHVFVDSAIKNGGLAIGLAQIKYAIWLNKDGLKQKEGVKQDDKLFYKNLDKTLECLVGHWAEPMRNKENYRDGIIKLHEELVKADIALDKLPQTLTLVKVISLLSTDKASKPDAKKRAKPDMGETDGDYFVYDAKTEGEYGFHGVYGDGAISSGVEAKAEVAPPPHNPAYGPNKEYEKGRTPLMIAIKKGDKEALNSALDAEGLNINYQSSVDGMTALMVAVEKGNAKVVQKIVDKGAKTTLKNKEGQTAADLARDKSDILKSLKKETKARPAVQVKVLDVGQEGVVKFPALAGNGQKQLADPLRMFPAPIMPRGSDRPLDLAPEGSVPGEGEGRQDLGYASE